MSDHSKWCREMFAAMSYGGVWGVPRTGLIFRKTGKVLLWVGVMPPKLNIPRDELGAAREREFETTLTHFSTGGVAMWRANWLRAFDSFEAASEFYGTDDGKLLDGDQLAEIINAAPDQPPPKKKEKVR